VSLLLVHLKPFAVNAEMTFSSLWYSPSLQLMILLHHVVTNITVIAGDFGNSTAKMLKEQP